METKYKNEDIIEYPLIRKTEQDYFKEMDTSNFIRRKRINELEIKKCYLVDKLERISKTFGFRILATLYIDENKFDVFLPKRFNKKIFNGCIRYWNKKGNLGITFLGGEYNDLKFGDMNFWFKKNTKTMSS